MSSKIQRSALLEYSVEQMYSLVNDVEKYPEFVKHCSKVELHSQADDEMLATLWLKKSAIEVSFTTRNKLVPNQSIEMQLEEGPFEQLTANWLFTPLKEDACKVELIMQFKLKSGLLRAMAGPLIESVGSQLVENFCQRAKAVYG